MPSAPPWAAFRPSLHEKLHDPPCRWQKQPSPALSLRELTEQSLLKEDAKVAVLVNGQSDLLYLHGRAGM